MSTNKKVSVGFKILLAIVLLISISIVAYIFLINREDNSVNTQQQRILKIKEDLITLIPEQYEVIESDYENPSNENDGCVFLYEIYPKEYSDIEKEYLSKASIIYCEDISKAVLKDQTEDVRYNQEEGKWLYAGVNPLAEKQYGNNLVSITALGGSHALSNYYIVRIENSDELIILSVPISNRIRCETYEDGVETMKEDCINFIDSLGMPVDSSEFVPDEIYEEYYNDLLGILKDIRNC